MPELSVIVPVYNVEKYLPECIESILNQTFRNLELILVDDGSPDKSGQICDDYNQRDNRITVIHKKNEGVSAARNDGIKIASGKYITFVDGDDWIDPDMYAVMISKLKSTECDMVICNYYNDNCPRKLSDSSAKVIDSNALLQDLFTRPSRTAATCWNKIYLAIMIKNILFSPELKIWEDMIFLFDCYKENKINALIIENAFYHYRSSEIGATAINKTFYGKIVFRIYIWDKIKNNPEIAEKSLTFYLDYLLRMLLSQNYKWSDKIKIKLSIGYWMITGKKRQILGKSTIHRFFIEGILKG